MNRTRILLAVLVMVVLLQLFPAKADLIKAVFVGAGVVYCVIWAVQRYLAAARRKQALAAQQAADDEEYRQYKLALDAIRERHDPRRDLDDPTSITAEYREELNRLHDRHQAMLGRKFGAR
jgi:hypothetical protein